MPIKSVKIKIPRKKRYFLMSQGSVNPIIRFLGQNMWSVARERTDAPHRRTRKWKQRTPFQGFSNFPFNLPSRIAPISIFQDNIHKNILLVDWSGGEDVICANLVYEYRDLINLWKPFQAKCNASVSCCVFVNKRSSRRAVSAHNNSHKPQSHRQTPTSFHLNPWLSD